MERKSSKENSVVLLWKAKSSSYEFAFERSVLWPVPGSETVLKTWIEKKSAEKSSLSPFLQIPPVLLSRSLSNFRAVPTIWEPGTGYRFCCELGRHNTWVHSICSGPDAKPSRASAFWFFFLSTTMVFAAVRTHFPRKNTCVYRNTVLA